MKNLLFFTFLIVLFFACKNEPATVTDSPEIVKLEAEVAEKATPENSKALEDAYLAAIAANPDNHEMGSRYLYRAAELQFRMNRYSAAAKHLQEALKNHYEGSNTPLNALLLGTVYKDKLKNENLAAALYQTFLKAFPNHEKAAAIAKDYGNETSMDAKIVDFGNRLMNDSTKRIDYRVANDFIGLCEINALMLPADPSSPDYLHKAGETARSMRSFPKALEIYDWIVSKYPTHPKAAQALFLKAFTYDNDLKKVEEARVLYNEFLKKYPNDEFADDTKFLLENLGKDDEEIINSFGKQ